MRIETWQRLVSFVVCLCAAVLLILMRIVRPDVGVFGAAYAAVPAAKAWFHFISARHVRSHPPAERPLTWTELRKWEAATESTGRIVFSILAAVAFIALAVWFIPLAMAEADPVRGWLGMSMAVIILVFAIHGTAQFAYVLWWRLRSGHRMPIGR